MSPPRWLREFERIRKSGGSGLILTWNVNDLMVEDQEARPLLHFLASHLFQEGYRVYRMTPAIGIGPFGMGNAARASDPLLAQIPPEETPERILRALDSVLRNPRDYRIALFIDYAEHMAPTSVGSNALLAQAQLMAIEILHRWLNLPSLRRLGDFIILVSYEDQVHDLLRGLGGYPVVPVDLPDEEMRRQFLSRLAGSERFPLEPGFSVDELARISGGLRLRDLETLVAQARAEGQPLSRAWVREWKARAIREMARDLVEVVEPEAGFEEMGGLAHVRSYFRRLRERLRTGDPGVPQAILLAGVPGTGKSYTVLTLARELDYPVLVMRNIRERWVGASERNLERVLRLAETLAPCVIWIDEVDQALGQRSVAGSADAGTSERMLARLWEFMGDTTRRRGRILWVATTNRPDLLDPATVDRFQMVLPFIHPSPREIRELLPILARRMGRRLEGDPGTTLNGFRALLITIRGLQEVLVRAADLADQEAGKIGAPIRPEHLRAALADYKPNFNPLQHEFIALTALRMTSFQSLLPWRCRHPLDPEADLPPYLISLVDEEGRLIPERVEERLLALRQQLHLELVGRWI